MDIYAAIKNYGARIDALEMPQEGGDTADTISVRYPTAAGLNRNDIDELRFDFDQALSRLDAAEARLDEIAAIVAGMEGGRPGTNEEESE